MVLPYLPEDEDSYYYRRKKHDPFCKRAGTKPVIEHLKADHRLCRNIYAGVFGDNINVMLAAIGFIFKRKMRILYALLRRLFSQSLYTLLHVLSSLSDMAACCVCSNLCF